MSSHREAPAIAKDPVADSTDLYAFVSPDAAGTVTLIANYIPLEGPDGGPNFFEFGDDVLYSIHIDNDGDALADITYEFRFQTEIRNPDTFLYNVGQITSIDSPNWNRPQFYSVTRVSNGERTDLGEHLASPPCNVGVRSTPSYAALANSAIHNLGGNRKVFAGQRKEGFYVDLGSIFDLGALRPFQNLHLIPLPPAPGVNGTKNLNVHTIALQLPISDLTREGATPSNAADPRAVIGVWTSASRRQARIMGDGDNGGVESGPFVQVSRLGNPLFNEVIVPMSKKDNWNSLRPATDSQFLQYVQHPELAKLLPILYPGVFPHLAALTASRDDLVAILLTGIPSGIIPGFQNFTGPTQADMLRLNVAIGASAAPKILGLIGGDAAGYPNGRRVFDDVVTIDLRAIAGVTYPLVHPSYTPDGAAAIIYDVENPTTNVPPSSVSYLPNFPYLDHPYSGFDVPS
ncbi:MAG: DUF4331 domain-containing protein [Candidatus Dormibacteraceae bacterium]